jgi:two-component system chemotaxis response regulator CheB
MINVLIVEDSRVVSEYLYYVLSQDPEIQVIGNVSNGQKAVEFLRDHKPDVISMDIDMPIMDGLEATRIIMETKPTPILIVTASRNAKEVAVTMDALAAGALSVIEKPVGVGHPNERKLSSQLVTMIKLMAEVKVVSRKSKPREKQPAKMPEKPELSARKLDQIDVVAIGVSSGGPNTLHQVFSQITQQFPYPILVVQHITEGFLPGLVNWLGKSTAIPMHIAVDGDNIKPGHIYFAPDHHQMGVNSKGRIKLEECPPISGICPSVAHLFSCVAKEYKDRSLGIILTGMGSDGAKEMRLMREAGAITIAQDKDSSLIHGMPGVAISLGAAKHIMSATEISRFLSEIERKQ